MKPIVLIPTLFLLVFMTINYQAILGMLGAQIETLRLRENAAGLAVSDNPPDATDSFETVLSDIWETRVTNGSGMVHPGPEFSSGRFEVKDGSLFMYLRKDPDFENKPCADYFRHPPDLEKFIPRFCSPIPFFIYRHALKDPSLGIPSVTSS